MCIRDSAYAVNVEALEKVQPKDLTAGEIGVRLGTTWIPEDVIEDFTFELLGTPWHCQRRIHIRYSKVTGEWNVSEKSIDRSNIRAYNTCLLYTSRLCRKSASAPSLPQIS